MRRLRPYIWVPEQHIARISLPCNYWVNSLLNKAFRSSTVMVKALGLQLSVVQTLTVNDWRDENPLESSFGMIWLI